jgi:hypothetical protein
MVRKLLFGCLTVVAISPLAAQAPQDQGGRINLLFVATPKPGMTKQLEDGFKRHTAWHARQQDTRTIAVSQVIFGDGLGTYRVVYPNLRWEDMDAAAPLNAGDQADVALNLTPYVESVESRILFRSDTLSRIPATEPAKAMNSVTWVYLNQGKAPEYFDYLAKLKQAHNKANSPYKYFVLSQITGADGPLYVLVRPLDKFAENTPVQNRQVLVAAYGELEADRLLNVPDFAVRRTVSFVTAVRSDLSYTPARR